MPILTNSRLEKFAQLPAGAKFRPSEAYRQCRHTSKNADANCQDLLANPSVAARIAELMAGNAQACKMTRKEALDWLVDIIKVEGVEVKPEASATGWPAALAPSFCLLLPLRSLRLNHPHSSALRPSIRKRKTGSGVSFPYPTICRLADAGGASHRTAASPS
jgi:hypothetical protein